MASLLATPLTDLNVLACGFATFAATIGYACTRSVMRSRPLSESGCRTSVPCPTPAAGQLGSDVLVVDAAQPIVIHEDVTEYCEVSEKPNRKRKRSEERSTGLGYPLNLAQIYPQKRPRRETTALPNESSVKRSPSPSNKKNLAQTVVDPVRGKAARNISPKRRSPSPLPILSPTKSQTSTPEVGFSAFAGDGNALCASEFSFEQPTEPNEPTPPAWSTGASVGICTEETSRAFTTPTLSACASVPTAVVTGEENEDLESELRNVKLFVKRGEQNFTEAILGRLRLLRDKECQTRRLLLRREPLLQVSMNVRIPNDSVLATTRITYETSEKALRVVLKEPVDGEEQQMVVIYALRPARGCSKDAFREFSKLLPLVDASM